MVLLKPSLTRMPAPLSAPHFFARYQQETTLLTPDAMGVRMAEGACRNTKDCKFLALAMACNAGVLVSGDDDLLSLKNWQGTQKVSPAGFLSRSVN